MKRYKKRKDLTNQQFLELKRYIMAYRLLSVPIAKQKYNFDETMKRLEIDHQFTNDEYILTDYGCIGRNIKAFAEELQLPIKKLFELYPSFKFIPAFSSYYIDSQDFGLIILTDIKDFVNMKKRLRRIYLYKPKFHTS